jgi:Fic family protein
MNTPTAYSWKHIFIKESGMIDPQPGYKNNGPGCLMYDNHKRALDFVLSDGWEISPNTPLDIHRFLTKDIPFFEKDSGKYRTVDVWIGHDICPSPVVLNNLMNIWFTKTKELMDKAYDKKIDPLVVAWASHHMFEVVHPFIDGNGRTGRLILNKVLHDLGEDPLIIKFNDRFSYYDSIEDFRNNCFTGTDFYLGEIL